MGFVRCYGLALGLVIAVALMGSVVLADTEPNDSLNDPETVVEGTFSGSVSLNNSDFYLISIPAEKDIEVTLEKKDAGLGIISIESYDENKQTQFFMGITITVTAAGETETDSYWNSGDSAEDIYLEVSGDGNYTMTIAFTNESSEAVEGFLEACGISMILIICVPIVGIIFLVVLIIVIVRLVKKKK